VINNKFHLKTLIINLIIYLLYFLKSCVNHIIDWLLKHHRHQIVLLPSGDEAL